jgi:hypothetical protein
MTKIINGCVSRVDKNSGNDCRFFNLKYFNSFLGLSIIALGFLYLNNISELTAQGFALRDLKSQASMLLNENMEKEEAVNVAQSYYSLSLRTQGLDMVSISNIHYLSNEGLAVAKR